jgi:hypothetical protein
MRDNYGYHGWFRSVTCEFTQNACALCGCVVAGVGVHGLWLHAHPQCKLLDSMYTEHIRTVTICTYKR